MATAEVTFPDGRIATVEGDENNIRDFINSLPESDKQQEQLPVEEPSLLKEFGKANEQVTNTIRKPFLGSDNGKPRSFAEKYSDDVMSFLESTKLKDHPNLEALAYSAIGKPAGLVGVAVDSFTDPLQIAGGAMMSGFGKATGLLEDFMAKSTDKTLKKFGIDLSNKKAMRPLAEDINSSYQAAYNAFTKSYDSITSKVGEKLIPETQKSRILSEVSRVMDKLSPADPAYAFVDSNLKGSISGNLNFNSLHNLKQQIIPKLGGLGHQLYDTMSDVLSSKSLGGDSYKFLTSQYKEFITKEAPYVEKLVRDSVGNVSSQKLMSKTLGIKTPIHLEENFRTALQSLTNRPTTGSDLIGRLDSLRKGTLIKRAIAGTLATGASMLFPQTRGMLSNAGKLLTQ